MSVNSQSSFQSRASSQHRAIPPMGKNLKASSNNLQVWFKDRNGSFHLIAKNVNKMKFSRFSAFVRFRLQPGWATSDPRCTGENPVLMSNPHVDIDVESAKIICGWIESNDPNDPYPLTLDVLGEDPPFHKVANLHSTAWAFNLDRNLRGSNIHDELHEYIHYGALTIEEFITVIEQLYFDTGLVGTALNHTMYLNLTAYPPLDMDKIEEYAKAQRHGLWERMLSIQQHIEAKKGETQAQNRAWAAKDGMQ